MARILVVDDTAQNLALIELYLRGTEFEVTTVGSGRDAIEQSMREPFDLILLDVVMPGIDGFETCRRLKNDPRTAFVPVIFLTGRMGDESEKIAAYQLGAVDYIQKPVDRDELVARIRVMLRLEEARSRLDRENSTLRGDLGKLQRTLAETGETVLELQQLRRELERVRRPWLLQLSSRLAVVAFDPELAVLLPGLSPGALLPDCGPIGRRLAASIENGASKDEIRLTGDGAARVLAVEVRPLGAGDLVLLWHELTEVREVERRLRDREPLPIAPEVPAELREASYRMTEFVGSSPAVLALNERVGRLRQSRSTVLIYGESGTGKELVARALHFDGQNRSAPFIPLHCGAIAPELIESELFGHEKGSFTGAQQAHEGLFRAADGGTIFLDEIAETSPSVQVKLLRVLQRGEVRAVGANQPRIVDVRIIAATNRDLLELVREGRFREDLYYRLEVVTLHLPPLRERLGDVPALAEQFVRNCNRRHDRLDRPVRGISRGAMDRMLAYSWPGNVRELENVVERAFALGVGDVLRESDLPPHVLRGTPALGPSPVRRGSAMAAPEACGDALDLRTRRDAFDREAIEQALRDASGDKVLAAQRLGIARSTFYRRLKELGL